MVTMGFERLRGSRLLSGCPLSNGSGEAEPEGGVSCEDMAADGDTVGSYRDEGISGEEIPRGERLEDRNPQRHVPQRCKSHRQAPTAGLLIVTIENDLPPMARVQVLKGGYVESVPETEFWGFQLPQCRTGTVYRCFLPVARRGWGKGSDYPER